MDIDILLILQSFRESLPDWFAQAASQFSDVIVSPIIYVVLAGIYWCVSKRFGALISMSIIAGLNITEPLKNSFCVYRPWIRDARIVPAEQAVKNATGYSFPSGHSVQSAAQFWTIAKELKGRRALRTLFAILPLLVGFSRNLLGVHTPQDVIAGLLIGALCLIISGRLLEWVEKDPSNDLKLLAGCVLWCAAVLFYLTRKTYPMDMGADGSLLVDPSLMMRDCFMACGTLIGFSGGFALERHCVRFEQKAPSPKLNGIRFLAGGVMMLALFSGRSVFYGLLGPAWGRFAAYGLLFFFVVAVYPWMFTAFERRFFGKGKQR